MYERRQELNLAQHDGPGDDHRRWRGPAAGLICMAQLPPSGGCSCCCCRRGSCPTGVAHACCSPVSTPGSAPCMGGLPSLPGAAAAVAAAAAASSCCEAATSLLARDGNPSGRCRPCSCPRCCAGGGCPSCCRRRSWPRCSSAGGARPGGLTTAASSAPTCWRRLCRRRIRVACSRQGGGHRAAGRGQGRQASARNANPWPP